MSLPWRSAPLMVVALLASACSLLFSGNGTAGRRDAGADGADAAADGGFRTVPTGLRAPLLRHVGCDWLDTPGLVDVSISGSCTLRTTDACELECDEPPPEKPSTCLVPAGRAEHTASEMCVMVVGHFEIESDGRLDVVGAAAVAILAAGPVIIAGELVADAQGQSPGPGGGAGGARGHGGQGPGSGMPGPVIGPGGGAAYGGWGGRGGCEGGGERGRPYGDCLLIELPGGSGGGGGSVEGGVGGGGGGALQVFSADRIEVSDEGVLSASGGGAPDIDGSYGVGGGGSGGTVLLEAPLVAVEGAVRADGGRGGSLLPEGSEGGIGGSGSEIDGAAGECVDGPGAAGGGGVGRVLVRTAEGAWTGGGGVSPELSGCTGHR